MIWIQSRLSELGLSKIGCNPIAEVNRYQKMPENEINADLRDAGLMKSHYLNDASSASFCFLVNGDHENARRWGNIAVEAGETYFFGEWRERTPSGNGRNQPPNRDWQDIHALWVDYLDWTMCLAASVGRWHEYERFATYLRDDVALNVDQTEVHRAWWLYFCGRVRERPAKEIAQFHETVVEAKRAKTDQLLLAWVDALFDGTDDELLVAMNRYFQHHRKVEVKKPGFRLAFRGSMLLHYGTHLGREVERPSNSDLYIVEFAN